MRLIHIHIEVARAPKWRKKYGPEFAGHPEELLGGMNYAGDRPERLRSLCEEVLGFMVAAYDVTDGWSERRCGQREPWIIRRGANLLVAVPGGEILVGGNDGITGL